jgi:DnaJ-class molecular chaperone
MKMVFEAGWPTEHDAVRRIRELLTDEHKPASCRETAKRLGMAKPLVDAVFNSVLFDEKLPAPCRFCGGYGHGDKSPVDICTKCHGRGM